MSERTISLDVGPAPTDEGGKYTITAKGTDCIVVQPDENPLDANTHRVLVSPPATIIKSKDVNLETVDGGRVTLRRDVLEVVALEQREGSPDVVAIVKGWMFEGERKVESMSGVLREHMHVVVSS